MEWVLRTARLGLRRLGDDDLAMLRRMPWLDAERLLSRSQAQYARGGHAFWAIMLLEDETFAGICGLLEQRLEGQPEIEVAYHVIEDYRGRGIASEAARGVMRYAFRDLGLRRLVSFIASDNFASLRVARKNGLRHERDAVFRGVPVAVYVADSDCSADLDAAKRRR